MRSWRVWACFARRLLLLPRASEAAVPETRGAGLGCDEEEDEDLQWRSRDPENDAVEFGWAASGISP